MISSPFLSWQWTSLELERPGVAAAGGVRSEMCRGGRWVDSGAQSPSSRHTSNMSWHVIMTTGHHMSLACPQCHCKIVKVGQKLKSKTVKGIKLRFWVSWWMVILNISHFILPEPFTQMRFVWYEIDRISGVTVSRPCSVSHTELVDGDWKPNF